MSDKKYFFGDSTLSYFWQKIKGKIPTKTSELTNDSKFVISTDLSTVATSGSYTDLSNKPTIPTVNNATLTIQKNGTNVNTFTANSSTNITANITVPTKISELTNDSGYLKNSSQYVNLHPENGPVILPFMNNDIAFLLKRGGSAVIEYDGTAQTLDISNVFDGSPSYWAINPTGITEIVITLTLHQTFSWSNNVYFDFGNSGWRAKNVKIEVMNSNYESDVWTQKYNVSGNSSGNGYVNCSHTPVGASNAGGGFNKLRYTFSSWATATIFRIAQLGIYNYGSSGLRQTSMSRGIDDAIFRNITPNNDNTYDLGSSSKKWKNIYATTFTGALSGNATSATKATQDENGNTITSTYVIKTADGLSEAINQLTTGTSTPTDSDYYVCQWAGGGTTTTSYHRRPLSALWTYINSKISSAGYTTNTGTVTSVAIKMNDTTKGTITGAGTIDLGTVITEHQDITGKQDKITSTNKLDYSLLDNTPTIPSKTSELTNDSNYVTTTDYATDSTSGVLKSSRYHGFIVESGIAVARVCTTDVWGNLPDNTFVSKGTLENVITGKGLVANTDYATSTTGGVVKVGDGLSITDGVLSATSSGGGISALDVYPVGSIYMSINNTDPSTLFGGTWEQIKDTFLLSCGDTYEAGATGGEAEHTLTVDEMPSHTHTQNQHRHQVYELGNYGSTGVTRIHSGAAGMSQCPVQYSGYTTATNQNTGGGGAHNNMPPYLAVYMWVRTA